MKQANRVRKNPIKHNVSLNEEQKIAKQLIIDNQIVIITGKAGSGKSLVSALTALEFLTTKQIDKMLVTRAAIEVGKSLGFLPGELGDKFNPYMEALIENLHKCTDKETIKKHTDDNKIQALPVQYIRGKTIEDILIVEEAQNLTKHEMLAILTRLGKTGKIIINGDNDQSDIRDQHTGLKFAIELSKNIPEIKRIDLKENHRSDIIGKILDYEYSKKS
jgi:phosphate starvation-inducible protein PhoH and related proteins